MSSSARTGAVEHFLEHSGGMKDIFSIDELNRSKMT